MKNKVWLRLTIDSSSEQSIHSQPSPEFNDIEIYLSEADGSQQQGPYYLKEDEIEVLIDKLQEMVKYLKKINENK